MLRFLVPAAVFVVMLYAFIDCLQTRRGTVRTLPKWLWLVVVVLVPLVGALAWLFVGRPRRPSLVGAGASRRGGPVAPDDDPAFLRKLADDEWTRRMRQRRDDTDPE